MLAADKVIERAKKLAAELLEAADMTSMLTGRPWISTLPLA